MIKNNSDLPTDVSPCFRDSCASPVSELEDILSEITGDPLTQSRNH